MNERRPDRRLLDLWLPLLRDLTKKYPSWSVWKNPESAFSGPGDIDSLAPPVQWDSIERTFRSWAVANAARAIVVCRHVPQGPHFVAVLPEWGHMLILDVKERSTWRGSTLIDYEDMPEVAVIDEQGFRRIRSGAEGVAKLLLNGVLKGGRPNRVGLRDKRVFDLLKGDREGAEIASRRYRPLDGVLLSGVDRFLAGGWDRRAMAIVEAWALAKAVVEPRTAISRLIFNGYTLPRCPILRSVRTDHRSIPEERAAWFEQISTDHEVELFPRR